METDLTTLQLVTETIKSIVTVAVPVIGTVAVAYINARLKAAHDDSEEDSNEEVTSKEKQTSSPGSEINKDLLSMIGTQDIKIQEYSLRLTNTQLELESANVAIAGLNQKNKELQKTIDSLRSRIFYLEGVIKKLVDTEEKEESVNNDF